MENEILFINPNYVFRKNGNVAEGGLSRNVAWESEILTLPNVHEFRIGEDGNTLFDFFKVLLTAKNKTIFFLYPSVGISMFKNDIKNHIIRIMFFYILYFVAPKNRLVFDISDLKFEQAIDLELNDYDLRTIERVEKKIMMTKADFIFASDEMRYFACKKYGILYDKTVVCANGGFQLKQKYPTENAVFHRDENTVYCVYAGTLNRGRNIEKMIEGFPNQSNLILILMGINGEWINDEYKERQNIRYIGAMEQSKAQNIVSLCDIGLIPYDENRNYYNIAYPTKLPFYVLSGIPILSTPVKEVKNIMNKYKIGWYLSINEWGDFISHLDIRDINKLKESISSIQSDFTWGKMLNNGMIMLKNNYARDRQ